MNGLLRCGEVSSRQYYPICIIITDFFFCICYVILVSDKDLCVIAKMNRKYNVFCGIRFVFRLCVNDAMENHHLLDLYLSGVQFDIGV